MSKKKSTNSTTIAIATVGIIAVCLVIASLQYDSSRAQTEVEQEAARAAALDNDQAPTLGSPGAQVHIVEFLDPACETCAMFYPLVKQWMVQLPGQIRLTIRHVPFHEGSDYAVRVLEASRNQNKYWQTLEALLRTQSEWTEHHRVIPERIAPAIASVQLNMEQLLIDMESPEIAQRMERDQQDAIILQVSKTPDYYVNGRPLPIFGQQQLADLVREELAK